MKCPYCDEPSCPYDQNYYCKFVRDFTRRLGAMKKKFKGRSKEYRQRHQLWRHLDNIMDYADDRKLRVKWMEAQVKALENRPSNKNEGPGVESFE